MIMAAKPNKKAPLGAAWMAGFMDGEGTISLANRASRNGRRQSYWEPCVSVVNTNLEVMLLIRESFGGSMSSNETAKSRPLHHKITYQIKWYGDEALALLESIAPYLMIKSRQADLVREFILSVKTEPSPGRRGHSAEVIDLRARMATEVQALNKKGA